MFGGFDNATVKESLRQTRHRSESTPRFSGDSTYGTKPRAPEFHSSGLEIASFGKTPADLESGRLSGNLLRPESSRPLSEQKEWPVSH